MAAIKSLEDIVAKWVRVTPGRREDYEKGIRAPRKDWATEAAAAEDAWAAAVAEAARRRAFSRGVTATGTAGWQAAAISKGVPRWPEGVRVSEEKYRSGFAPYHDEIARITLPPRGPAGDPANIERVRVIADALHQRKVRGS